MFNGAESFNQNLNSWNAISVRDNQRMFWDSGINKLPKWYKKRAIADLSVNLLDGLGKIGLIRVNRIAEVIANPRSKKPKIEDKPQNDTNSNALSGDSKLVLTILKLIACVLFVAFLALINRLLNS